MCAGSIILYIAPSRFSTRLPTTAGRSWPGGWRPGRHGDITRLRNALYFKLLQDVPAIPSLRTQFVHLYMRDQSGDTPQTAYTDCGLYTQVELPNNRYLRNHALSMDGSLYKANMCELSR